MVAVKESHVVMVQLVYIFKIYAYFLTALGLYSCITQKLLSSCGARASLVAEHGL